MPIGIQDILSALGAGRITPETAALLKQRYAPNPSEGLGRWTEVANALTPQQPAPIPLTPAPTPAPQIPMPALPAGNDTGWLDRADAGETPVDVAQLSKTAAPVGTPIPGSALNQDSAVAANPSPTPTPSGASGLIEKGYDEQRAAVMDARLGAAEAQTGLVGETIKQAQMLEDARKQEERFQQEKQQRLDSAQEIYKQSLADLNAQKIDPDRLYANATTSDKIVAAIGIALGGIASGLGGRPNSAMEIIKDAINRDVDAQKVEVDKKSKNVAVQGTLYNDLVGRLQNEDAARHYLTSLLLEQSKAVLDQYKTQISSAQQNAALGKLAGEIDVAAGESKQKGDEAALKDPAIAQATRAGVLGGKIDPSSLTKEDRERYVPSLNSFARDSTQAAIIETAKKNYDKSINLIDQIIAERKAKGAEVLNSGTISRQQTRAGQLQSSLKEIEKLGALSGSDYTLLYSQVPKDPTEFTRSAIPVVGGFFDDSVVATLSQLKKDLTSQFQGDLGTLVEKSPTAANLSTDLKLTPR